MVLVPKALPEPSISASSFHLPLKRGRFPAPSDGSQLVQHGTWKPRGFHPPLVLSVCLLLQASPPLLKLFFSRVSPHPCLRVSCSDWSEITGSGEGQTLLSPGLSLADLVHDSDRDQDTMFPPPRHVQTRFCTHVNEQRHAEEASQPVNTCLGSPPAEKCAWCRGEREKHRSCSLVGIGPTPHHGLTRPGICLTSRAVRPGS